MAGHEFSQGEEPRRILNGQLPCPTGHCLKGLACPGDGHSPVELEWAGIRPTGASDGDLVEGCTLITDRGDGASAALAGGGKGGRCQWSDQQQGDYRHETRCQHLHGRVIDSCPELLKEVRSR